MGKKYGVNLVDIKTDKVVKKMVHGEQTQLCRTLVECDYLINVPVLKGDCQTRLTRCLKNLKGCIPDSEKRRYHAAGLHNPIALLNTALRPDLHIIDSVCGDFTFEEGGNPVQSNRILMGFDPVLLDSYCARLLGYEADEIAYLRMARDYAVGRYADDATRIVELGSEGRPLVAANKGNAVRRIAEKVEEGGACSACYAALVYALNKTGYKPEEKIKSGKILKESVAVGWGSATVPRAVTDM